MSTKRSSTSPTTSHGNSPWKPRPGAGVLPQGTTCDTGVGNNKVWFSHDGMTCPPTSAMGQTSFPSVAIIGAGIAGLSVAYEMVRARKLSGTKDPPKITVYEKSSYAGGKIVGYFRNNGHPVEHSTRIYAIGYAALFEMLSNIPSSRKTGPRYNLDRPASAPRCVLDDLIPMYVNYISAATFNHHFSNMPGESPVTTTKNIVGMLKDAGVTDREIRHIMDKFVRFFKSSYPERLNLTAGMTIGQYLDYPTLSPLAQEIMNSYIGIIVAARTQCDAYAIMTLFEALGMFGSPRTTQELKDSGLAGGNLFPGPSSEYFIQPLVNYLMEEGVVFKFNTPIDINAYTDMQNPEKTDVYHDAVVLALPHMVSAELLGPNIMPANLLRNEWSFGVQFYVDDFSVIDKIMIKREEQSIYNCVLGSPWQIIYATEYSNKGAKDLSDKYGYKPFWGRDDFGTTPSGKPILAVITATVSNQYHVGIITGKPALMCTPSEMMTDILTQMGIGIEDATKLMANNPSFGSLLYVTKEVAAQKGPEWLRGPIHTTGFQWISDYTLFVATPNDPSFGSNGMCNINNMFDNPACVNTNDLPGRLTDSLANSNFHYAGIAGGITDSAGIKKHIVPTTFDPLPSRVYLAGEYCSTPNFQIPTMEKACESGKVAAQRLISDFGIRDAQRVSDFAKGKRPHTTSAVVTDNFVSASTLVQVDGLKKGSELIDFVVPTTWEKLQIALYTGFNIGYPSSVVPIVVGLGIGTLLIIILIILLVVAIVKKHHKQGKKPITQTRTKRRMPY